MQFFRLRNLIDYPAYVVLRIFVCVVQAMPIERCASVARALATICCDWLKIRHQTVHENLSGAFPELTERQRRDLAWRMWEHLFLMVIEVIHAPRKIHQTNWREYVTLVNADRMIRAFFEDRATVIVCGHYGNFEVSGFVLAILGFPSYTIARPLDNPFVDRFLNEFRGMTGQYILPKTGSAAAVESVLAQRGILAFLGDQHAGQKGCWVKFFGRPASSHKGIALFTLGGEALTMFCFARRQDKPLHQEMGCTDLIDPRTMSSDLQSVTAITEWYTGQLESTIRQAPHQYWWLHRRWRERKPRKKRKPVPPSQNLAA